MNISSTTSGVTMRTWAVAGEHCPFRGNKKKKANPYGLERKTIGLEAN